MTEERCPIIQINLPKSRRPKRWDSIQEQLVPPERNLYGHLLANLLWQRKLEKNLIEENWEKVLGRECLYIHRPLGLFLSVYVDDIEMAGKQQFF